MKPFADLSLRSKLLVTSSLLVLVVTSTMLAALLLNLSRLRDQAIPDQRVILSLKSLAFDYLSEIREYAAKPEEGTLEELEEIELLLAERLNEHRALATGENSRSAEIEVWLARLTELGREVLRTQDRILENLQAAEAAEEGLLAIDGAESLEPTLVTRSYEFLSKVREYSFAPSEDTAAEVEAIEAELTFLGQARATNDRTRIVRLLETGRAAVRLRQELDDLLENLEDAEQELSHELEAAVANAAQEVHAVSRTLLWSLIGAGLVGLGLAAVVAFSIASQVSGPLEQLQDTSRRLADGELSARTSVTSADEVGRLSQDFNHLAAEIERLFSELQQAKVLQESIVASVPSGLVTVDRDRQLTSANPVFRAQWNDGEPISGRLSRWISSRRLKRAVEAVLDGGQDVHGLEITHRFETETESHEIEPAIFRVSIVGLRPVTAEDEVESPWPGGHALLIFEDVTESRQLTQQLEQRLTDLSETQSQLVQSGKLAAVGELAAGVAHELNNPLSVVLTYSVLLREKLERASDETRNQLSGFTERLELMKTSAERCKDIIDNLLLFSRQDDAAISRVDANDLLSRTFDLIGSQLRRRQIALTLEVEDDLPPIRGNFNQLQQVLTNLAINAHQAMPEGGELDVQIRRQGESCELTMADTGPGIPQERLGRIFEPFYTTKPVGEGTGLGLAITYGIVQGHGGEVTVDSQVGQGTTFRIRLPFAETQQI